MQRQKKDCYGDTPRILHLVHEFGLGGIEKWVLATLRNMAHERFVMDVCHKGPSEGELAPQAREAGAQLLHCPLGPALFPFIQRLKRSLVQGQYSILHVHTQAHSGPAVYAARAVGVPVVTTFHSTERTPQTAFTRLPLIRNARAIYANWSARYALLNSHVSNGVSQGVSEAVTKTAGLETSSCGVFYLGCSRPSVISDECKLRYREELDLHQDARAIIHVGSFKHCKNHDGILRVFQKVVNLVPSAVLVLVGDGQRKPEIESQIRKLGLENHIRMPGWRRDATALLQSSDLFFFPSHHEGLSIAMMEASAVGLPIVASNIPGNREATDDGDSARLHDVPDVDGMARSIITLLRDSTQRRLLGERARAIYERTFSIEASVDRLATLYDRVLSNQGFHRTNRNAA